MQEETLECVYNDAFPLEALVIQTASEWNTYFFEAIRVAPMKWSPWTIHWGLRRSLWGTMFIIKKWGLNTWITMFIMPRPRSLCLRSTCFIFDAFTWMVEPCWIPIFFMIKSWFSHVNSMFFARIPWDSKDLSGPCLKSPTVFPWRSPHRFRRFEFNGVWVSALCCARLDLGSARGLRGLKVLHYLGPWGDKSIRINGNSRIIPTIINHHQPPSTIINHHQPSIINQSNQIISMGISGS